MTNLIKDKKNIYLFLSVFFMMLTPNIANANALTTIGDLFANGTSAWQAIIKFLGATMFIAGFFIFGFGITKLRLVADGKMPVSIPFTHMIIGALLVASPSLIMTVTETYYNKVMWKPSTLLHDIPEQTIPGVMEAMTGVLIFIKLLGIVAFFRGLLMYKAMGSGKEGNFGKATTHVLGGILAINIQSTVGILARTFFSGSNLPMGMENW